MTRPEPGTVIALVIVAEALAADVWLIRRGHKPISTCVRDNPTARRIVRWFDAHLTDTVTGDLLTFAGARLARRTIEEVAHATP